MFKYPGVPTVRASVHELADFAELMAWRDGAMAQMTTTDVDKALAGVRDMRAEFETVAPPDVRGFDQAPLDWHDLRSALLAAEAVAFAARNRAESRGARQREDCPDPGLEPNRRLRLGHDGNLVSDYLPVVRGVQAGAAA